MRLLDFFRGDQPPLVEAALNEVVAMLAQGRVLFRIASGHLLDNLPLSADLHALDEQINEGEQNLRRMVLEHLSAHPDQDLVFCLKLVSIVQEAERIGDLSKTLAQVAGLAEAPRDGAHAITLRRFRDRILTAFDLTRTGFVGSEEAVALRVMRDHEALKRELTAFLVTLTDDDALTPNEGVVYALGTRMMSRISSHLANTASTVIAPFDQIRRDSTATSVS